MHLEELAQGKVNLALAVTGRRQDGYHELRSVFLRVGLSDRVAVSLPEPPMSADHLAVPGDPHRREDEDLVLRGARLVRAEFGDALPGLAFILEKSIPVGGGMGGGSADGAAAMRLAARAWGVEASQERLVALAIRLGADVPFFAAGHPAALVSGIGERIEPLPSPSGGLGLLLIIPAFTLPTEAVFAAFDRLERSARRAAEAVEALSEAMRQGLSGSELASARWLDRMADANDLWPAAMAVAPRLSELRTEIESRLGARVLLTGSGATLVGLYPSAGAAADAGRALAADPPSSLRGAARLVATDDLSPDPMWRHP